MDNDANDSVVQAHFDWRSICAAQGWNQDTQLGLAMRFIEQRGMMLDFVAHAQAAADEENQENAVSDAKTPSN